MNDSEISLRAMTPEDGPGIAALSDQSVDAGAIGFHNLYQQDAYEAIMALHENASGVVAEATGHPGIVGMGMMSLGECQYEGTVRPYAYLFSLGVHPGFRRRGIASRLAAWRIKAARERFGSDGLIYAGVQAGNTGSLRTASHWNNQTISGRTLVAAVKMRSGTTPLSAPKSGIEIRPAQGDEYGAVAGLQNMFYANHNFYPPRTGDEIRSWHALAPFGSPIREYFVASDRQGNLLAGMSVTEESKLVIIEIQRMSQVFKIANYFFKFFPADRRLKRLHIKDLWFAPGMKDIGKYLWETMRWQLRDRGNMMMSFVDMQTPLVQLIDVPWYFPKSSGAIMLSGPQPLSESRPIYFLV